MAAQTARGAVFLFTDYTVRGPYVGQLHARVLERGGGELAAVDLMHDAPAFRPDRAAYLLASLLPYLPDNAVVAAIVDPGVGTERRALAMEVDGRWLVGPDNGLMAVAVHRAHTVAAYEVPPPSASIPATFHGRDVFVGAAADIARTGQPPAGAEAVESWEGADWPLDQDVVVYVDGFGNLMTGRRAATARADSVLEIGGCRLGYAEKFADVPVGEGFWYGNAMGLVEVAVNAGSAAETFGAGLDTRCYWHSAGSATTRRGT